MLCSFQSFVARDSKSKFQPNHFTRSRARGNVLRKQACKRAKLPSRGRRGCKMLEGFGNAKRMATNWISRKLDRKIKSYGQNSNYDSLRVIETLGPTKISDRSVD